MRTVTSKILGDVTGFIAAGTTITFNALTLGATAPIVGGAILGVLLINRPTNYLSNRIENSHTQSINKLFETHREPTYPAKLSYLVLKRHCYHFCLQAASCTLGSLIGLAATSAFISIAANPFTVPALIAGGISLAMMIALYVLTIIPARPSERNRMEDIRTTASLMRPILGQIRGALDVAEGAQAAHLTSLGILASTQSRTAEQVESAESHIESAATPQSPHHHS